MVFPPAVSIENDESLKVHKGECVINGNEVLFSCAGALMYFIYLIIIMYSTGEHQKYKRLCPCRHFTKGQIAHTPS